MSERPSVVPRDAIPVAAAGRDYDGLLLHDSPLRALHERYARDLAESRRPVGGADRPGAAVGQRIAGELEWLPYGVTEQGGAALCELVASYGDVEPEYAAIRRGAGIMDCPQRGTLIVTGKDRRDFLNRMLTQELKDLGPGMGRESFWLNRKGRIEADVHVMELGERTLMDVDFCQAASAATTLGEFVFTEDVAIADASREFLRVVVHGPWAERVVAAAAGRDGFALQPGAVMEIVINTSNVVAVRRDSCGVPGVELIVPRDMAVQVWEALLATDATIGEGKRRVRPIGWHAFNIARIEAGTPLMNIDFSSSNLPHETGVLRKRVSFTKGCYLGQEVVARMESLGQPKQVLVGSRMDDDRLPVAGSQVFARREDGSMDQQIGAVTSSTLSPMLGAMPIAFAMIRTAHSQGGTKLLVNAEAAQVSATVGPLNMLQSDAMRQSTAEAGTGPDV